MRLEKKVEQAPFFSASFSLQLVFHLSKKIKSKNPVRWIRFQTGWMKSVKIIEAARRSSAVRTASSDSRIISYSLPASRSETTFKRMVLRPDKTSQMFFPPWGRTKLERGPISTDRVEKFPSWIGGNSPALQMLRSMKEMSMSTRNVPSSDANIFRSLFKEMALDSLSAVAKEAIVIPRKSSKWS